MHVRNSRTYKVRLFLCGFEGNFLYDDKMKSNIFIKFCRRYGKTAKSML